ncbi:hypothetical protein [Niabella beijingensis]|uniref:hypothetical protein n=1 Tax=Niabella beijingensis TaxID=2872700 RepID=UPI001CBC0D8B|nr:hypothetical protein [Niabella beijingensis]MBZ4189583.1 hypothetical protein [Niabella beijingensis]
MKNFIQRVNHYFLERYPLLWNTRVYWMLGYCVLVHGCFYLMGYNVFKNTELFKHYNAPELFVENGALLFSIIVSVLILVVWLLVLFRNNAFKNFYPTGKRQLFGSFFLYFLVFFAATTFYISYIAGYKHYVQNNYPAAWLKGKVAQANLAAAFLTFDFGAYTIDNKRYPAPFDTLYCETNEKKIDFSKPYLTRDMDEYQFYTVGKKRIPRNNTATATAADDREINRETTDSSEIIYYKKEVADVSGLVTAVPSFYNYSRQGFGDDGGLLYYNSYPYKEAPAYSSEQRSKDINRKVYELLQRNQPQEIKKLLTDFLELSKRFNISTDLTPDKWFELMYHPGNFPVTYFIGNHGVDMYAPPSTGDDAAAVATVEDAKADPYYKERKTRYCFDANDLNRLFSGIESVQVFSVFDLVIYVALWVAFALAALLFAFRITNLRLLLFAGITATLTGILIALLTLTLGLAKGRQGELTVSYLVFAVGTLILLGSIPVFRFRRKSVQGILINISLVGIVPYFFLILLIITLHQEEHYRTLSVAGYGEPHKSLLELLGVYWNYVLLALGFIFMIIYTSVIRKWRALPEK